MDKKDKRINVLESVNEETRSINEELKKEKTCLHCSSGISAYCEDCYQKLISTNARLQLENNQIKSKIYNQVYEYRTEVERKLKEKNRGYLNGVVYDTRKISGKIEAYNEMLKILDN